MPFVYACLLLCMDHLRLCVYVFVYGSFVLMCVCVCVWIICAYVCVCAGRQLCMKTISSSELITSLNCCRYFVIVAN